MLTGEVGGANSEIERERIINSAMLCSRGKGHPGMPRGMTLVLTLAEILRHKK